MYHAQFTLWYHHALHGQENADTHSVLPPVRAPTEERHGTGEVGRGSAAVLTVGAGGEYSWSVCVHIFVSLYERRKGLCITNCLQSRKQKEYYQHKKYYCHSS